MSSEQEIIKLNFQVTWSTKETNIEGFQWEKSNGSDFSLPWSPWFSLLLCLSFPSLSASSSSQRFSLVAFWCRYVSLFLCVPLIVSQSQSYLLCFTLCMCCCFLSAIFHCDCLPSLVSLYVCVSLCIRVCVTSVSISFYFSLCVCVSLCQSCVLCVSLSMDVLCLSHTTHTHTHRPKGLSLNHRENKAKHSGTLHLFRKKFSKVGNPKEEWGHLSPSFCLFKSQDRNGLNANSYWGFVWSHSF